MNTKICNKCGINQPLEMFAFRNKKLNTRASICKKCRNSSYAENAEESNRRYAERRHARRDSINAAKREYMKSYREKNYDLMYEYFKQYREVNRDRLLVKRAANECKRRAALMDRTPPWLDSQHLKDIEKFYTEAKQLELETGTKHHVDHIVPLLGKTVCGLHVPWNLQVLTAHENQKKSNKLIYDYKQSNL